MQWVLGLTSKRRTTFPKSLVDRLGVGPGESVEVVEDSAGRLLLRSTGIQTARLAPLRSLIRPGTPAFDIAKFREGGHDRSLGS